MEIFPTDSEYGYYSAIGALERSKKILNSSDEIRSAESLKLRGFVL